MRKRQCGGMVEFIPSPAEKRDDVIHNHVMDLLSNLDARLQRIEDAAGLSTDLADCFAEAMTQIISEEEHVRTLHQDTMPTISQST